MTEAADRPDAADGVTAPEPPAVPVESWSHSLDEDVTDRPDDPLGGGRPMDDGGDPSEVRPGIGAIVGGLVAAVTDARGPVNMGSGAQIIFTGTGPGAEARPPSPRLIAEELLHRLAQRFVAPPSHGTAKAALRRPGTVLLAGADGSGRRTSALMLLHTSGGGAQRFRELPEEADGAVARSIADASTIEPGDRLLLDLTDPGAPAIPRHRLVGLHAAVEQRRAFCVVVLSERWLDEVPDELRPLVVRNERPNAKAVLLRHLAAAGIAVTAADLALPALTAHVDADPMREVARLARLIGETREAAEGAGTPGEWVEQALVAASLRSDAVAAAVRDQPDGRLRALLLAAAMFERTPSEVVHHAAEALLRAVRFAEDERHGLERPALAESLDAVGARIDGERRVRFRTVTYGAAVRAHFWDGFPGLRPALCDWIDTALRQDVVSDRDRETVLRRFAEQCLRTRHSADLFTLVERWSRSPQAARLLVAAAGALAEDLAGDVHGARFRRQLYTWATRRELPRDLALTVAGLCAEVVAPTRPEQALVRLRHLTRNVDGEVAGTARDVLVVLSDDDPRFRRRVLQRLAADLTALNVRDTDIELFVAIADPVALAPHLADADLRASVVTCVGALAVRRPPQWRRVVDGWLAARHAGRVSDALLDVLVDAASGRVRPLSELYLAAADWAARDPSRRATAAELARRANRATVRPAARPEGALR